MNINKPRLLPSAVEEDAELKWGQLKMLALTPPSKIYITEFAVTSNFDKRRKLNLGMYIIELLMYFKIAKIEKSSSLSSFETLWSDHFGHSPM